MMIGMPIHDVKAEFFASLVDRCHLPKPYACDIIISMNSVAIFVCAVGAGCPMLPPL